MSDPVTVLAVDDQPANLRLLDALLSPRGYRVLAAGTGESALATLAVSAVDLVLLDIVMPGMDGYQVCRRIRNDPTTAFLPVVVITASGNQEKVRAIEAGADDMQDEGEVFEIFTSPENFEAVNEAIKKAGIQPQAAEVSMVPQNYIKLEGQDAKTMLKLYDALEDNDDVQKVYATFDIDESEMG